MNFKKSKLYKTIVSGSPDNVMKTLWEYLKSGKDVNLKDETTGETLLHVLVQHGEKFSTPETVQAIYMLVCKDIDIDAQDNLGETGLHKVMRIKGTYRIMMALLRCGIDTAVTNNDGKTAEDVLVTEKPECWEEMLHWYSKFKPGLWRALSEPVPDRKLVERLLKQWCRLTCVKNGKVTSLKTLVKDDVHKIDLLHMLEEYENANEMALALQAGFGFIVKSWMKQGTDLMKTVDADSRDYSYQYSYPDSPQVPRPLLAAAWETNSYETVDVLMDFKPNTKVLYTNEHESKNPPKPLFFQLVCGNTIPRDEKILLRIFKGSDLQARDKEGHTILHKVILHSQPESTFKLLMQYGANVAARDLKGQTPRDLAEKLGKTNYTKCIDEYIIKLVKDKKFDDIEKLILHNYDSILCITDASKKIMLDIAKRHSSRQVYEVIKLSAAIQGYVKRVFQTVDEGAEEDMKKLLSCRKYHNVRDKCGRTLIHTAIMKKRKDVAMYLAEECPENLHVGDTLDRTPLHYCRLLSPDGEVINSFIKLGADPDCVDANGMKPGDYTDEKCGSHRLMAYIKEVRDLDMNIYLSENDVEASFKTAVDKGDIETVKRLVTGLQAFGDTSKYNSYLFDCIDNNQTEMAKFLITSGFKCDIYKQYTKCDPNDPMCAMMECGHSPISLKNRAEEKKCDEVVQLIEGITNGQINLVLHDVTNGISNYAF